MISLTVGLRAKCFQHGKWNTLHLHSIRETASKRTLMTAPSHPQHGSSLCTINFHNSLVSCSPSTTWSVVPVVLGAWEGQCTDVPQCAAGQPGHCLREREKFVGTKITVWGFLLIPVKVYDSMSPCPVFPESVWWSPLQILLRKCLPPPFILATFLLTRQSSQPKKQLWCFSNMEESWDFNLETNELNFSVLFQSEGFALKKGKAAGTFSHHASFPAFALFHWKTE